MDLARLLVQLFDPEQGLFSFLFFFFQIRRVEKGNGMRAGIGEENEVIVRTRRCALHIDGRLMCLYIRTMNPLAV